MSFNFNINGSVLTPKGEQYPAANYGAGMKVSVSFNGTWDGYVYRYCFIVSGDKTYLFKMTKGDNDTWTTDLSGRGVSGTVINISFYGTKNEYPKNNDTANPRMTTNSLMIHLDDSLAGHITPSTNIDKSLASDILNAINTAESNSSSAGAAAHNAEEFAKQAQSSAQSAKDQADASARSAKASSDSATASGNSASYANERAVASQRSADASATSANAASASADTSKAQAQESARQAGIATQKAKDATDQADRAKAQADEATRQAGIATADAGRAKSDADRSTEQANRSETQANASEKSAKNAGISAAAALSSQQKAKTSEDNAKASETEATRQAGIATAQATEATKQAGIATAQAGEAKKQATTATTKAQEASTSAQSANTSAQEATRQTETATTQATEATKQAKIATTKAQEASTSATNAKTSETKSQGLVDEAHKWHDEIMANIQSAKDNADVAVRQADRAKSEANRAESSAHNAMLSEKNAKESADKADSIKHFVEENVEKTTQQATAAEEAKNKAIEAKDQALSYRDEINSHLDEANDLHNKAMALDKQAQASAKASADSATASADSAKASAQSAKDAKDTASKTLTQAIEIADGAVKTKKEVADLLSQTKASESEASKYAQQAQDSATASKASQDEATHQATLAKNNRDEVFANIARAETGADMAMEQAEEATRQADIATEAAKKAKDYKVTVENLYDPITQTAEQAMKDAKKASDGVATINQSKADVAEMKETVLASQLDVETNKEIVKGLLAKTQQSEANAKASETAAKESETNAKTSETNTATMETHVSEMQTNVTNMQTNVTNMQTNVSGMKDNVSQMKQDVIGLKNNVSSMKDDVTQLKADTIALKDQVMTARNETETFKTQAGTSASAAATSESNTKKAETNVTQMKADVTQMKTDVSKMKDDVTKLKSDTATIKAQADETKTAIETLKTATETSAKKASDSATAAAQSATNAKTSETNAIDKATEATTQAGKAKTSAETATSQATIATTKAGEASTSAGEAKTQADIATTKATEASTSATAAAGSAKSASDTKTAIDQEKDRIDKAVDKLEKLEIGGRNLAIGTAYLILDTRDTDNTSCYKNSNDTFRYQTKKGYSLSNEFNNIKKGDTFTISYDVEIYKCSNFTRLGVEPYIKSVYYNGWTYYTTYNFANNNMTSPFKFHFYNTVVAKTDLENVTSQPIIFLQDATFEDGGYCVIKNLKIEKGNQSTDWTPAPEDFETSIADAKKAGTDAQSTANTATTKANNAQSTADIAQNTANIARDEITHLTAGGRNYIQNADKDWAFTYGHGHGVTSEGTRDGSALKVELTKRDSTDNWIVLYCNSFDKSIIAPNTDYTYSFKMKVSDENVLKDSNNYPIFVLRNGSDSISWSNQVSMKKLREDNDGYVTFTATVTTYDKDRFDTSHINDINCYVMPPYNLATYWFKEPKLEIGNTTSDWSIAPEDAGKRAIEKADFNNVNMLEDVDYMDDKWYFTMNDQIVQSVKISEITEKNNKIVDSGSATGKNIVVYHSLNTDSTGKTLQLHYYGSLFLTKGNKYTFSIYGANLKSILLDMGYSDGAVMRIEVPVIIEKESKELSLYQTTFEAPMTTDYSLIIYLELGSSPAWATPKLEKGAYAVGQVRNKNDFIKAFSPFIEQDTAPNENLISWNRVMNRNCFAAKFDYQTKIWTTWVTKGDDAFGYGLFTNGGAHSWVLPYGESITYSFEVKPSERLKWGADINSISQSALGTDYTGNDIDEYLERVYRKNGIKIPKSADGTIKIDSYLEPNKWTKCSFTFSNTYADRNKNKVSIADDNVNFGVVTDSLDAGKIVTVQYRNIKVEYGNKPTRFIGYKQEDNGGENFIKNSGSLGNARMSYADPGSPETYAGGGYDNLVPSGRYLKFTADNSGISTSIDKWNYEDINLQAGEGVTLSVYMKTDCDDPLSIGDTGLNFGAEFMNCWLNDNQLTNSWKRFILTGIANKDVSSESPWYGSAICFYFSKFPKGKSLYISSPKLERGSVATAWSERPIDNSTIADRLLSVIFDIAGPQELTKGSLIYRGKTIDNNCNLIDDSSRSTIKGISLALITELYNLSDTISITVAGKTTGSQYSVDLYFIKDFTNIIGQQTISANVDKSPFFNITEIDKTYMEKMISLGVDSLIVSYKDNNDTKVKIYFRDGFASLPDSFFNGD